MDIKADPAASRAQHGHEATPESAHSVGTWLSQAWGRIITKRRELLAVALVIGVAFVVGVLTVSDYGQSWDEGPIYNYADYALRSYQYFLHPQDLHAFDSNLDLYGPAYFMAADIGAGILNHLVPLWSQVNAWHFIYFLTFCGSALMLYLLARRWVGRVAACGTALLYLSQPLFWGHAFINPKDLPFEAFFLLSVYLGLVMGDRLTEQRRGYVWAAIAGAVLGFTTSIRIAGPLAGLLVCIPLLARPRRNMIGPLVVYVLTALLVCYSTWPFLWSNPIRNAFVALQSMSRFSFDTQTLFMGSYHSSYGLPWFYVPVILGLQLTVPVLLLAVAGFGVALWRLIHVTGTIRGLLLLIAGWFIAPVLVIIGMRSTLYDNARQLYFLLPPIFLLVALSLDAIGKLLRSRWWISGVVLICMLPGLYAGVRLHPYEYVYYNELVGGTSGAYGKYEMDYWGTSYREVGLWLNTHAEGDVQVLASPPRAVLQLYLRPGLTECGPKAACVGRYDYSVAVARWNAELGCLRGKTVYSVQRGAALFAVVKQLSPGRQCN